jgi:F-type H+-transporting ATPase subunit a
MFIRAMALAIRLFANMLSGHLVVYSMLGLIVTYGVWASPALVGALGIYVLDVFVSFLQAYIFTLLSAIFIGERYHPAH